jgi:predicted NAD-dependent protein-ADP-ribosyltransferase YbiA (DUF1768 family)
MGDAVKEGEIPVGVAERSEQEGQEEKGEEQEQEQQEKTDPAIASSDSDPLSSLPLATLTPLEQGPSESKEGQETKEQEQGEGKEEEGEEEKQEREAREQYSDDLEAFYRTRSRYVRGIQPGLYRMINKLLKDNNKVPGEYVNKEITEGKGKNKKTEKQEVPVHGLYFVVVKDKLPAREEKEEGEEEQEQEEEPKKSLLFLPESAKYTTTGDLQNLDIAGEEEPVTEIPIYRPLTTDELFANLDRPNEAIRLAQKAYNEAHAVMRLALKEEGHPNLKISMNLLEMADLQLLSARYAARDVYNEYKIPINTVLLERRNDTTKIDIGRFIGIKIPITRRYVTDLPSPAEQALGSTANVIVINMPDSENGILSPFFQLPITIGDIAYSCAYKAILSLLVPELGPAKDVYIDQMAPIDNPYDLMEYDALIREGEDEKKIEGHLATLIAEVYTAALQQNPTMANTLKATGDALLVVVPQERPMDSFLGVGVDPNQTELIRNPTKWKGRNMYGKVLMDLRKTLPDVQVPVQLPVQFPVQGEVPAGSIPLDEDIAEEEGEEEVPEIVLQQEEATPA